MARIILDTLTIADFIADDMDRVETASPATLAARAAQSARRQAERAERERMTAVYYRTEHDASRDTVSDPDWLVDLETVVRSYGQ